MGVLCLVLVLLCITWDPFLFYGSLGWGRVGCFAFVVFLMCLVTVSFVVFSVLCLIKHPFTTRVIVVAL